MTQRNLFDVAPVFTNRSTKAVTFQGKLGLPIHRWYRLTPSFSPALAEDIAREFGLGDRDFVLDPFSGVGTVPLCMKCRGIPSCSVEINPYLHFVGTVKTRTYSDVGRVERALQGFCSAARDALPRVPTTREASEYLSRNASAVPNLNFIHRWWSPGNLMQLVALRTLLLGWQEEAEYADLLRLGLLAILVPVSNAKHNHVSLTFADKPLDTVDVVAELEGKYAAIAEDLSAVRDRPWAPATVYRGNSKSLRNVLPEDQKVSAVITSPPYPNRFSYARETRPHLFFFDFVKSAKAVGQLETDAIGGTWGKATSVLSRGRAQEPDGSLAHAPAS